MSLIAPGDVPWRAPGTPGSHSGAWGRSSPRRGHPGVGGAIGGGGVPRASRHSLRQTVNFSLLG